MRGDIVERKEEWEKHPEVRQHELDYARQYNEDHKEQLKEKKKNKYNTDPEFRARALKRAHERYLVQREIRQHIRQSTGIQQTQGRYKGSKSYKYCPLCLQSVPPPPKPVFKSIQKKYLVSMFTVREVARRLGKQMPTVAKWIKQGIIPETLYKEMRTGPAPTRLWTQDQVELLMRVFDQIDTRPPISYEEVELVEKIQSAWDQLKPLGIDVSLYTVKDEGTGLLARESYDLPLPKFACQSEVKYYKEKQLATEKGQDGG
jgi:hypothetical protein